MLVKLAATNQTGPLECDQLQVRPITFNLFPSPLQILHTGSLVVRNLKDLVNNNLYLENQYEQQQRTHHDVYLTLSGQRVEVSEGVPWMLQERCPLLLGHGAAAQVEPANRRCQSQFTDAQKSPG